MEKVYIKALAEMLNACNEHEVEIENIQNHCEGFCVTFSGFDGNAVCHKYSYGSSHGNWETIGFPWDENDVSVHNAEWIARNISKLDHKNNY